MSMIEINWKLSRRELKQFTGIWFPLACAMICWLLYRFTGFWQPAAIFGGVGAVLAVMGFLFPAIAHGLYVGWMVAALPIGWLVSHLLMGLIYYGLITPMGLLMRLCGHDAMGRRFDPARDSYWGPHQMPTDKKQYFRQY